MGCRARWRDGKDTLQNAADELFLCSVAGILHHEVGHIERGHDPRRLPKPTPGLASKDDPQVAEADAIWLSWEKEADAWSADWLLQGLDETDDRFLKRVIGIALGFLWSASRNVHTGCWLSRHHPPVWDRIYQNVKQHIPSNPGHPIWLFIAYVLQLHLCSLGQAPPVSSSEDAEDWVNQLLDYIANAKE